MWTKPFYAQRELMGPFRCVLDELQKVHYTEKLQIISRHYQFIPRQ